MFKPLAAHEHSGKPLPHHHTSYSALVFLTLVAGVMLMMATKGALALAPQTGQVNISAVVHGTAPSAPTITAPVDDQHFTATPITVEGTCGPDYKVVVYDNGTAVGSGICKPDGTFSIKINLFDGRNELFARQYDGLDQASPDSNHVAVFYDRPVPITPPGKPPVQQFIIRSDSPYKTAHVGDEITWPYEVLGGTPPYAVSWNWGDGTVDVISLTAPGSYSAKHVYTHDGNYRIIIKGTDSKGQTVYLELLVVVTGEGGGAATTKNTGWFDGGLLVFLWPLYFLMVAMITSFWLGERYEYFKVKQRLLGWRRDPYNGLKP